MRAHDKVRPMFFFQYKHLIPAIRAGFGEFLYAHIYNTIVPVAEHRVCVKLLVVCFPSPPARRTFDTQPHYGLVVEGFGYRKFVRDRPTLGAGFNDCDFHFSLPVFCSRLQLRLLWSHMLLFYNRIHRT